MGFAIGFGIGFVIGWVVFKRPEWVERGLDYFKSKLGW